MPLSPTVCHARPTATAQNQPPSVPVSRDSTATPVKGLEGTVPVSPHNTLTGVYKIQLM